ncbi:hypothetical protein DFH08DRAFT_1025819, partial [Mycena albidolilacea]
GGNLFLSTHFCRGVVLELDSTPIQCGLAFRLDEMLRRWATHFRDLLNCILERGCTSLTAINGTYLVEAYQLDPPGFPKGFPLKYLPERIRSVLLPQNAKSLCFRRNPIQGTADDIGLTIPLFSGRLSRLNSLNIASTLIVPPGLYLTLAVLRHSPITSLVIHMSLVELRIRSAVLPCVASACPNVTRVSLMQLDSPSVSPIETFALTFLARFPRLVDVELTHMESEVWPAQNRGKLHAPAIVVEHLLSRPSNLPAIRAICVLWTAPNRPHLKTLIRFLLSIARTLARRRLTPELSVWIESLSSYEETTVLHGLSDAENHSLT